MILRVSNIRLVADLARDTWSTRVVLDVKQITLVLKVGPRSLDHQHFYLYSK